MPDIRYSVSFGILLTLKKNENKKNSNIRQPYGNRTEDWQTRLNIILDLSQSGRTLSLRDRKEFHYLKTHRKI